MIKNNKMKTGLIGVAAIAMMTAAVASANANSYTESAWEADTVTQTRDVDAFTKIRIKGSVKLEVTGGEGQNVSIDADDDFVNRIITKVEDGTLIIDMDTKGKKRRWNGSKVAVKISMQKLEALRLDGAMDGAFTNLNGSDLDVTINGAGNLSIEGSCGTLRVRLSGAGNVEAEDFKCKNVDVRLSGAGNIEAYATEKADVRLSGIGNIDITGNPAEVSKRKGGFGSIDIR